MNNINEGNTEEATTDTDEVTDNECPICFEEDRPFNITLKPCGHKVVCDICVPQLKFCPRCTIELLITVNFRGIQSDTYHSVRLNPYSKIFKIKETISRLHFNSEGLELIFIGRFLDENKTLHEVGVENDNVVWVCLDKHRIRKV